MKLHVKSLPEFWEKEKNGLKPNTVRKQLGSNDIIVIENTKTGETFERQIRDVTLWEDYMVISWVDRK